jgi:universal stress protein A
MKTPALLDRPTILVPVDFDESSRRALELAVEHATAFRGRIVLLHVLDGNDISVEVAERLLDDTFVNVLCSGAEVRKEVRRGPIVDAILDAANACKAVLVIVGTHGRKGARRMLLGSVAESVVRRAPMPVLVARDPAAGVAREHSMAYAGAATLSGAVAGAAVGAVAGPPGALAGGVVGTAVGAIVGVAMSRDEARVDAHDRELDDEIGVTKGPLGASEDAKQPSKRALREAAEEDARRAGRA